MQVRYDAELPPFIFHCPAPLSSSHIGHGIFLGFLQGDLAGNLVGILWFRFSGPQHLATGKHGCREVRVYPTECGEQLGKDPSKNGSSKSLLLKREHFGTRPFLSPSLSGIRLNFVRPHFPCPKKNGRQIRANFRACFIRIS